MIYPAAFERHAELVRRLQDVRLRCGYDFPSVSLTVDWVLNEDQESPTVDDVYAWLNAETAGPEPAELSERLRQTLERSELGGGVEDARQH